MGMGLGVAVIAAGAVILAAGRPWLHVTVARPAPFGPVIADVSGRKEFGAVTGLAVVALLAVLLIAITARTVRKIFGVLLGLAGLACCWYAIRGLATPSASRARDLVGDLATSGESVHVHQVAGWPVLTAVAGLLVMLAGIAVLLRGRAWNDGLSQRYSAPAAAATSEDPWRTLDRGDDPTIADR
jgi:hypothetical protein